MAKSEYAKFRKARAAEVQKRVGFWRWRKRR
jgi:hypothetical protein